MHRAGEVSTKVESLKWGRTAIENQENESIVTPTSGTRHVDANNGIMESTTLVLTNLKGVHMILGEELRRKYALTSLKANGKRLTLLAINEALEVAADIADQEKSPAAASRIRSLKWVETTVVFLPKVA